MDEYRIRWAYVSGSWEGTRRMCMAERRIWLLGLIPIWWPTEHGRWRNDEAEAEQDIEDDVRHRQPLPSPRLIVR